MQFIGYLYNHYHGSHVNHGKSLLFPFHRRRGNLSLRRWKDLIQNHVAGREGAGTPNQGFSTSEPRTCSCTVLWYNPLHASQPFSCCPSRAALTRSARAHPCGTACLLSGHPSASQIAALCCHPGTSLGALPPWQVSTHLYSSGKVLPPLWGMLGTSLLHEEKAVCPNEWRLSISLSVH